MVKNNKVLISKTESNTTDNKKKPVREEIIKGRKKRFKKVSRSALLTTDGKIIKSPKIKISIIQTSIIEVCHIFNLFPSFNF
ncbi:MAG: hypothetical protein ACTSPD_18175 [Promethearchaeota archaeon]